MDHFAPKAIILAIFLVACVRHKQVDVTTTNKLDTNKSEAYELMTLGYPENNTRSFFEHAKVSNDKKVSFQKGVISIDKDQVLELDHSFTSVFPQRLSFRCLSGKILVSRIKNPTNPDSGSIIPCNGKLKAGSVFKKYVKIKAVDGPAQLDFFRYTPHLQTFSPSSKNTRAFFHNAKSLSKVAYYDGQIYFGANGNMKHAYQDNLQATRNSEQGKDLTIPLGTETRTLSFRCLSGSFIIESEVIIDHDQGNQRMNAKQIEFDCSQSMKKKLTLTYFSIKSMSELSQIDRVSFE